ncbi:hypothetical protein GCM10027199_58200 [Amycolatopsis magusensis]
MITLVALSTSSPPPVMVAPEPTPISVLFDFTSCMPLIEMVPLTRITAGLLDCIALISADELVTVTGEALPPPVVPAANPVGVPAAAAGPAEATVSAAAAATVSRPGRLRLANDLRMS